MGLNIKEEMIGLIADYLSGKADKEGIAELEGWLLASPENKAYFLKVKNVWEVAGAKYKASTISTDLALRNVMNRISREEKTKGIWYYWQKIAAVLMIPLILGTLFWYKSSKHNTLKQIHYNEVYAAYGTRSAIKLDDGSLVWLNSGSSLKYPDKFIDKERVVFLKGEAYFEVHSDLSQPFIVKTSTVNVKATGTKFNVMAFNTNRVAEVTLVSGKVAVNKADNKGGALIAELKPNQHFVMDTITGNVNLNDESVYKYISWKDGKLIFRNEPLSEVVKKISQIYQVDIELRGEKLQEYSYRATFEEESLNEILKLLKLSSPIDYKEISRKPLPDGSFPKKKIIIFPIETQSTK